MFRNEIYCSAAFAPLAKFLYELGLRSQDSILFVCYYLPSLDALYKRLGNLHFPQLLEPLSSLHFGECVKHRPFEGLREPEGGEGGHEGGGGVEKSGRPWSEFAL